MRRFLVVGILGLGAALWSISCQGPDELFRNAPVGLTGTAGTVSSTGGQAGTGVSGAAGTGAAGTGAAGTGAGGGGRAGTNGMAGTNGRAGTNGMAGTTGAGGAKNCVDAIKLNGYSAVGASPCSACKENGNDKSAACQTIIDCEDTGYPCTGNCLNGCNNTAGADSIVAACASNLVSASCPGGV